MKPLFKLILIFLTGVLSSCGRNSPINTVADINKCDSEIIIRNWELTKPVYLDSYIANTIDSTYNISSETDQGDNLSTYEDFSEMYSSTGDSLSAPTSDAYFIRYPYHMSGSYIRVDSIFRMNNKYRSCYAAAIVKSDVDADVALIGSATGAMQVWVNNKQALKHLTHGAIGGYQYLMKVHFVKGDNFVLLKLIQNDEDWSFLLKACSLDYANSNSVGAEYASTCENYLVADNQPVKLKIWSPFIAHQSKVEISIYDINDQIVLSKVVDIKNPALSLKNLPTGPYNIEMKTDSVTLRQNLFYGHYKRYFTQMQNQLASSFTDDKFKRNASLLFDRFKYMDTVKVTHDNAYQRKVANVLYELGVIYKHYTDHTEAFAHVKGLHLRVPASLDNRADSYMIYVPRNYMRRPVPLVVMMPHETGVRNFAISTYVSDINRVEHICKLADKFGYAVLWSSFRVYDHHNPISMIPHTIMGIVDDVRRDYNIDTTRLFAYGDCAGGEIGLLMSNKYPSLFAAVAVEGPAIPDPGCDNGNCAYKSENESINDFYNTIENFKSFPVMIAHSVDDQKANIQRSIRLVNEVKEMGGDISLKKINVKKGNDRFYFFTNLMPDNKILSDFFKFYSRYTTKTHDSVLFAVRQLKYNKSSWIRVNNIVPQTKGLISATFNRPKNQINVTCSNILSFSIDANILKPIYPSTTIMVNGAKVTKTEAENGIITVNLTKTSPVIQPTKNEYTEGPVNDFFGSPYLIVRGTTGDALVNKRYDAAIDTFKASWKKNYLGDTCRIKKDIDVTTDDIERYNIILIGTGKSNMLLRQIEGRLPICVNTNNVSIGGQTFEGNDLSFLCIYPNPLNSKKYVLVASNNARELYVDLLKDIQFGGWYDYIVNAKDLLLGTGYFGNHWN